MNSNPYLSANLSIRNLRLLRLAITSSHGLEWQAVQDVEPCYKLCLNQLDEKSGKLVLKLNSA